MFSKLLFKFCDCIYVPEKSFINDTIVEKKNVTPSTANVFIQIRTQLRKYENVVKLRSTYC